MLSCRGDEQGFEINNVVGNKLLVFSAIGYSTKKIYSDSIKSIIELEDQITELQEVIISKRKINKEIILERFNKNKINSYFACGINPWITARYFEYKEDNNVTPFLKQIRLLTNSDVKDSKFIIRLYNANKNGEP